jgi:hypothetical protein
MTEVEPDYSQYSRKDLHSALSRIDREKYPERVTRIKEAINKFRTRTAKNSEEESGKTDAETLFGMVILEVIFCCLLIFLCIKM